MAGLLNECRLPTGIKNQINSCVIRDSFKAIRGPVVVGSHFYEGLRRIDPRLVLRFHPVCGVWMVYVKMPHSNMLYSQPVHVIETGYCGYRNPSNADLLAVRKAAWIFQHTGLKQQMERLDQLMAAQSKATEEARIKATQEWANAVTRDYELTWNSFKDEGVSRGFVTVPKQR